MRGGASRPQVCSSLALIAGALPAQAEVINHQRFADSFSDDFELCGIPVHSDGEESGFFHQRVGTGDLDTLYLRAHQRHDHGDDHEPSQRQVPRDREPRGHPGNEGNRVEGTIFQVSEVSAGQPFVLRDMTGAIVLHNRGAVRGTILFDTLGDDTPGGVVLEVIDVRISGPHPELDMDEDAFCAVVQDLIG